MRHVSERANMTKTFSSLRHDFYKQYNHRLLHYVDLKDFTNIKGVKSTQSGKAKRRENATDEEMGTDNKTFSDMKKIKVGERRVHFSVKAGLARATNWEKMNNSLLTTFYI